MPKLELSHWPFSFSVDELFNYIDTASQLTYAAGKLPLKKPERLGFTEYQHSQGRWSYRDSYAGFLRGRGTETVRFDDKIVWISSYGGGMMAGHESIASDCFEFLKQALSQPTDTESIDPLVNSQTLRGPLEFTAGAWHYHYVQEGDISEFSGYEEIMFDGKQVFFHRVIGGVVIPKGSSS